MCLISLKVLMKDKTYPEAGDVLYEILVDNINKKDKIVLDMEGVVSLPSMFLNMSIGRFIENYGVDFLRQKISFAKISLTQADRLKDYIDKISVK